MTPSRRSHGSFYSLVAAASTRAQTERRITHILSVCLESIPAQSPQSGIVHMRIPVEDKNHADLLIWLPHACRFIDDALRSGGIVLVHGVHGLSRGATVMAAYRKSIPNKLVTLIFNEFITVMRSRQISPTEALDIVRRRVYSGKSSYNTLCL